MATSCLGAADSEAELELEFSYGEVSVANSLPALNEEIIDGKTDINPDETGTGSFHSSLNISQGISTSADAGPSACLTPVQLQLLPPPMHSTPISTSVYKQLVFQESFSGEELNSEESSMIIIGPSDTSYCNFTHENVVTDSILLQSSSTSLIDLSDSDCNGSLILIEPDLNTHTEIVITDQHYKKDKLKMKV